MADDLFSDTLLLPRAKNRRDRLVPPFCCRDEAKWMVRVGGGVKPSAGCREATNLRYVTADVLSR